MISLKLEKLTQEQLDSMCALIDSMERHGIALEAEVEQQKELLKDLFGTKTKLTRECRLQAAAIAELRKDAGKHGRLIEAIKEFKAGMEELGCLGCVKEESGEVAFYCSTCSSIRLFNVLLEDGA